MWIWFMWKHSTFPDGINGYSPSKKIYLCIWTHYSSQLSESMNESVEDEDETVIVEPEQYHALIELVEELKSKGRNIN